MTSGCVIIDSSPTQITETPHGFPSIQMDPQDVTCGGELGAGGRDNKWRQEFITTLCSVMPVEHGAPLILAKVGVDVFFEEPKKGEFVAGFFSTFIPFLPLKQSSRDATCVVTYSLRDASGAELMSSSLKRNIGGLYKGWAVTRLASLTELQREQRLFAAHDAARMVASDLFSKVSAGEIRSARTRTRGGPVSGSSAVSEAEKPAVRQPTVITPLANQVQSAVPSGSPSTPMTKCDDIVIQLYRLRELKDSGSLSQQEYESRRKALIDKQ